MKSVLVRFTAVGTSTQGPVRSGDTENIGRSGQRGSPDPSGQIQVLVLVLGRGGSRLVGLTPSAAHFGDCEGWQYPQQKGVTTRVVLFDDFGCDRGPDRPDMAGDDV